MFSGAAVVASGELRCLSVELVVIISGVSMAVLFSSCFVFWLWSSECQVVLDWVVLFVSWLVVLELLWISLLLALVQQEPYPMILDVHERFFIFGHFWHVSQIFQYFFFSNHSSSVILTFSNFSNKMARFRAQTPAAIIFWPCVSCRSILALAK